MGNVIKTREGLNILVDELDYELLKKYKWHMHNNEPTTNIKINGSAYRVRMKIIIMGVFNQNRKVFYINQDTLDNRRINLSLSINKFEIQENHIKIYSEDGSKYSMVDLFMYDLVSKYSWSIKDDGYLYRIEDKKRLYYHNLIMNCEDGLYIDHIDNNPANNLISNLRTCTIAENNRNKRKANVSNVTSRYKGVSYDKKRDLWRTRVGLGYKEEFLEYYTSELAAASSYNYHAKLIHGEYCKINDSIEEVNFEEFKAPRKIDKYSSSYGVTYHKHSKKWVACYRLNGKYYHVGSFNSEIEASMAYDEFVIRNKHNKKLNNYMQIKGVHHHG